MKTLSKIWGVSLVVAVIASLLVGAIPAFAGTNSWGTETIPSTTGKVIVEDDNIVDMAVAANGSTIYTTLYDSVNSDPFVFKSTDAGKKWSDVSKAEWDADGVTTDFIAVSPSDPDIVAFVDRGTWVVWLSTNGGSSWNDLGSPTDGDGSNTINYMMDIAISPKVSGVSYVTVAGSDSSNYAAVYYFDTGKAAPKWRIATRNTDDWEVGLFVGDEASWSYARAVAFSPNFASDRIMGVVVYDTNNDDILFEAASFAAKSWNEDVGGYDDYPVAIDDDGVDELLWASIAFDADYLGSDSSSRLVFVGTDQDNGEFTPGGIFRLSDTSVDSLKDGVRIHSVAYNSAADKLVAGAAESNSVYRLASASTSDSAPSGASTYKKPGVNDFSDNVTVAWSGNNVVAGAGGADGAFAVSRDDGKSFNDISLVNTPMGALTDVAISADGAKKYLAVNDDNNVFMLWRYDGAWEKVFDLGGPDTIEISVRPAPEDFAKMYVFLQGEDDLFYTSDGGETKWTLRFTESDVQDLAVESADVIYVAAEGSAEVQKSNNGGFLWDDAVDTGNDDDNYMLDSLGKDKLILGSVSGDVAYSTDGNANWATLGEEVGDSGNTQVTASGLASGDFIYASTSGDGVGDEAEGVYRWTIGTSTSWDDIIADDLATYDEDGDPVLEFAAYGIELSKGTLYVLGVDLNGAAGEAVSAIWRTLGPSTATDLSTWSFKETDEDDTISLTTSPQALRVSTGSIKLWAVDTGTGDDADLYSFTDTLADASPTLVGPATAAKVRINPVTGRAQDVTFTWSRLSNAKEYDLKIALDKDFTQVARTENKASTDATVAVILGPFSSEVEWQDGMTYYWRVRVSSDGPLYSQYSETRTFTIDLAKEVAPPVTVLPAPAPIINLPAPVINLPAPTTITIPPAPIITIPPAPAPPAPIAPAYIWAVVIIGAVLVIAVIILIVRTRRPV